MALPKVARCGATPASTYDCCWSAGRDNEKIPTEPTNASSSGYNVTPQDISKVSDCKHHWKQEKTTHEVEAGKGLSNVGMTAGICLKCGATKDWQSVTPDGVHGMDSHILSDMGGTDGDANK